jgi:hypothetical protein
MNSGIGNIVAALIIAAALIWTGGFGGRAAAPADEDFDRWYARAVGDIRNDIVVNCGCCGEGPRRAEGRSF